MLQSAPALREGVLDGLRWNADKSGVFTVASAYKWNEVSSGVFAKLGAFIWKNVAPPKMQFFGCWRIWSNVINWWGVSWMLSGSVSRLLQWWDGYSFNKKEKVIWKIIPLAVLWSIWRQRNELIFSGTHVDLERLRELIKIRIALWFRASNPSFCYSVTDIVHKLQQVKFCLMS
ncbi:uncharacterized protein LOC114258241 [Camellia sinensis]|uniref:uncharacterized protein LOC114258241 n=1 Tax=Camellia sinensis TaxID=4442 RepID=UPI001036C459|nr:uncharacterized protein LOC114258241 [Camellia sinensis]